MEIKNESNTNILYMFIYFNKIVFIKVILMIEISGTMANKGNTFLQVGLLSPLKLYNLFIHLKNICD